MMDSQTASKQADITDYQMIPINQQNNCIQTIISKKNENSLLYNLLAYISCIM